MAFELARKIPFATIAVVLGGFLIAFWYFNPDMRPWNKQ